LHSLVVRVFGLLKFDQGSAENVNQVGSVARHIIFDAKSKTMSLETDIEKLKRIHSCRRRNGKRTTGVGLRYDCRSDSFRQWIAESCWPVRRKVNPSNSSSVEPGSTKM
jgi:hypothetical protein